MERDPVNGHLESNPFSDYWREVRDSIQEEVELDDPELWRITRLRLVSDPGFPLWDLSYCYGTLRDGTNVRVHLPEHQWSKKKLNWELVEMCKKVGVYGKRLGILDPDVQSKLV